MSLPDQTQVLIVGAGPSGLVCAITLAGLGVQVTIVDAAPTNQNGSRASLVHARTLEELNTIGLARPLIDAGIPSGAGIFYGGADKLLEFNVAQLYDETEFPIMLLIPQHEVERIFRQRLAENGVQILRNKTVVGVKESIAAPGVDVTFEDGAVIHTRYVVGADGSRSTIRRIAGIEFKDPQTNIAYDDEIGSSIPMVLADIYLDTPPQPSIPRDKFSVHLDKFLLFLPLRSKEDSGPNNSAVSFWRIVIRPPIDGPALPRQPSLEYLQHMLDERTMWAEKMTITSVATASRYRVRSAVASTFFKKFGEGNILLVGDAAHVHSPAGGQGMNLGICDAVLLGRSIHSHIKTNAEGESEQEEDLPLIHYSSSRRKIAVKVISMTKGLNTLANAGTGWRRIVRNTILWVVSQLPFLRRLVARRMSGLMFRDV